MRITIANRLHPFSHEPGTSTILMGTGFQVQIFPTLLRLYSLEHPDPKLVKEVPLQLKAPLKNYTVENNFEHGRISVWWHTVDGFVRYHLFVSPSGMIRLEFDKGEGMDLLQVQKPFSQSIERLSLGIHKKQDFDQIRRRLDLAELWPFWFQLGQSITSHPSEGSIDLLEQCRHETKPENIKQPWLNLFKAGFHGILVPRLVDEQHQGFCLAQHAKCSPLALLSEGAELIRSHFIREDGNEIQLLPLLPPELHCGRMTDVHTARGTLNFEWTKKFMRRLVFHSSKDQELLFAFRHCKQFRLRQGYKDKGLVVAAGSLISLEANKDYFFDNFT